MKYAMNIKKILKNIAIKIYYGNPLFRKNIKRIGKDSFIREHTKISGGRYITIGNNTRIYPYSRLECFTNISGKTLNPRLQIGDNIIMGRNTTILCANEIVIGSNCMFGSYCFISDENHGMDPSSDKRYECQPLQLSNVIIGENCWIGEKVIILPGITIGDNSIVGAGSIVTRDIPPNTIAVGNPARVIKRFNYDTRTWEKV